MRDEIETARLGYKFHSEGGIRVKSATCGIVILRESQNLKVHEGTTLLLIR